MYRCAVFADAQARPGDPLSCFVLRLAYEGAIEVAVAVRATQFRQKSSYGEPKRGVAVLILAPGHPITIWQLGDMGSMSRVAPRRGAGVNKRGYRLSFLRHAGLDPASMQAALEWTPDQVRGDGEMKLPETGRASCRERVCQ